MFPFTCDLPDVPPTNAPYKYLEIHPLEYNYLSTPAFFSPQQALPSTTTFSLPSHRVFFFLDFQSFFSLVDPSLSKLPLFFAFCLSLSRSLLVVNASINRQRVTATEAKASTALGLAAVAATCFWATATAAYHIVFNVLSGYSRSRARWQHSLLLSPVR